MSLPPPLPSPGTFSLHGLPRPGMKTNIGTTVPPRVPPSAPPPSFRPPRPGESSGIPVAMPVAQMEGETPGPKVMVPEPLWVSRWQPTATVPASEGPWVTGYRLWHEAVAYQGYGVLGYFRLDFMWRDHRHAYTHIPRDVWFEFRGWTGSVGQWFHENILVPNWKPGRGARYPNFPL